MVLMHLMTVAHLQLNRRIKMRLVGNTYVDDFVCLDNGVYGIADEFKSLRRLDKVHVSIQTCITGYGFVMPRIRTNGKLVPLEGYVEKAISGRYPIYSSLDDSFIVVRVEGDLDCTLGKWTDSTRVEFFTLNQVVGGMSLQSPQKGVISLTREVSLESVPVRSFTIGKKVLMLDNPIPLRDMILTVIQPYVLCKSDFYKGRTE